MSALEHVQFEAGYFQDAFLEGSKQVLLATSTAVSSQLRGEGNVNTDLMQSRLVDYFSHHREKLAKDECHIGWDIKDVKDVRLGSFNLALGLRRRQLVGAHAKMDRMFYYGAGGMSVVLHEEQEEQPKRLTMADVSTACGTGGTVAVEAVITCLQETNIYRAGIEEPEVRGGEREVTHLLTLEADLEGGEDRENGLPYFNSARGWILADINHVLGGNSVLAQVKAVE